MVQRKAPKKIVESQRHQHLPTDQQHNTRSKGEGGGGDQSMNLVKKKKKRPNKLVDGSGSALRPNYMKPTSSSDARKERPKVTLTTTTTNSYTASDRNHSKPSIKILNRKPSLRRARPLKVVNRETCSSTLKDSKFPEALELGPGGTEAEGTSAMRVCPYNYCSLNGHWHEPLPPLKSFMSARRKVVQAQKSFKLKGLSSVKVKGSGKDDKRIDTGQTSIISRTSSGLPLIPLIEEIANDFFVEIYAKSNELDIKLDHDSDAINTQKEDVTDDELDNKDEMTLGEDVDQESDLSVEQMDDLMNVMEYVDCYQQIQVQEEKQSSSVPEEDYAEWCAECFIFEVLNKGSQVLCESKTLMSTSDHSDYPDDVLGSISLPLLEKESTVDEFSLEPSSNVCEIAEVDAEKLLEDCENSDGDSQSDDERIGADIPFCCNTKTPYMPEILVQDQPTVTPESTQGNEQDVESTIEAEDSLSRRHDESDSTFLNFEDKVSEEREGHESAEVCDEASELANLERKQNFDDQSLDHPIISHGNKEQEDMDYEVGEFSSLLIFQISEPCQGSAERNIDMTEGDHIQTEQEAEECKWYESLKDPTITPEMHKPSIDFRLDESNKGKNSDNSAKEKEERNDLEGSIIRNTKHDCLEINEVTETETEGGINSYTDEFRILSSDESTEDKAINATANSDQPLSEAADKPKAKKRTIRTRATEAPQKMKDFNPRSPRFLEVEPDSEAEKVDLRHQMMDERKNAEEWLIDYALQQTVSKLDPARKRKVALLVKAFETVMPLPICEEPRRYATSGFAHARPTQACN